MDLQAVDRLATRSEVINVFVPTTPNPTSGFLLMVPQGEAIPLEMTVAEGMKLVISGGSLVPPFKPKECQGASSGCPKVLS